MKKEVRIKLTFSDNSPSDGSDDLQRGRTETLAEELRHGGGVQMLRHDTGAAAQNDPGQKRAEDGVADARPGGSDAVFPAELTCVADENDGGEIRGSVCERGQPGTDASAAENEAVDVGRVLAAIQTDADHDAEKDDES